MPRPSVDGMYDVAALAIIAGCFLFIFLLLYVLERV